MHHGSTSAKQQPRAPDLPSPYVVSPASQLKMPMEIFKLQLLLLSCWKPLGYKMVLRLAPHLGIPACGWGFVEFQDRVMHYYAHLPIIQALESTNGFEKLCRQVL